MNKLTEELMVEKLEKAKELLEQYNQVALICMMYKQGASATSCMERIQSIVKDNILEGNKS